MSAPLFTTRDFCGLVYRLLNPLVSPGGCRVSWLFFKARATSIPHQFCAPADLPPCRQGKTGAGRKERATRKNSQLAAAQRVTLKIGRRLSGGCRIGYVQHHFYTGSQ